MFDKVTTDYIYDGAEMLATPDLVFDRLRTEGDVLWSGSMGRWLVLSKSAAQQALREKHLKVYDVFRAFSHISNLSGISLDQLVTVSSWIPFLNDGARHKQLRSLFARVLQEISEPYHVAYERASLDLVNQLRADGGGDFATQYADRIHVEAFGRICGISADDRAAFAQLASSEGAVDFAVRVAILVEANERAKAGLDKMEAILARSEQSEALDFVGRQLESAGIQSTLSAKAEFLVALTSLGRDTLAGTLTLGLAQMFDDNGGQLTPKAWCDPAQMTNEFIRLSSAVQIVNRVATKPVTIAGQHIAEGEVLMIYLPAANRDPAAFACPHQMDIKHDPGVPFGAGGHLCVGMQLTRKAIEISLRHLSGLSSMTARPGRLIGQGKNTRKYEKLPITVE